MLCQGVSTTALRENSLIPHGKRNILGFLRFALQIAAKLAELRRAAQNDTRGGAWRLSVVAVMLASPSALFAHTGDEAVTPQTLWSAWTWDPLIVISLLIAAMLYIRGLRRGAKAFKWQMISFAVGWLTLLIALISPLHRLGSVLFSAHMSQHELLMLMAAPLLVLGRPLVPFLFAFSPPWRLRIGQITKTKWLSVVWKKLTQPLNVWLLHGFTLWIWHLPSLYQATLESDFVHALQHISFLGTALLFWWTLIHGRYGRMGYGTAVFYIFTTAVHSSILGALLTLAGNVWYPIYQGRTILFGMRAIEDQQLGGLIMWIPSGIVFVVLGLALFAAWLGESERRLQYSKLEAVMHAQGGPE